MSKVRPETILWGAGTALGELPPYFIAKSARLSGYDPDDADDLQAFEELKKKRELGVNLSILERAKLLVERIVEKVGFLGILACASVSLLILINIKLLAHKFVILYKCNIIIYNDLKDLLKLYLYIKSINLMFFFFI